MNNSTIKLSYLVRFFILTFIIIQSCSDNNEEVKPTPPSNLVASAISASQINLSWTDNSTNETGFKIERKTGTGIYAVVATIDKDLSTYSDENLTDNTTYTYRVYSFNSAGNSPTYSNETNGTTLKIESLSTLTTTSVTSITPFSAISGGNISSDGNSSITARGVIWSTSPNPTIALSSKTTNGSGLGSFVSSITSLNWDTQYYLRSYATNSSGTAYGNEITFTTSKVEITTATTTNISPTAALSGGTISSNAGASLLAKGVVWSITTNPTVALTTKTSDGTAVGTFQSSLKSLSQNTLYYVRAYATNSFGTFYGNEVTFTTATEYSFVTVASGTLHSLVIQNNGTLFGFGRTLQGDVFNPVQIGSGSHSEISGGFNHSHALKTDGSLWAWGLNTYGQLGSGAPVSAEEQNPIQIGTGYSEVEAGEYHSLAIKSDGSLWVWGRNDSGQLGDGTEDLRRSPVQIGTSYSSISGGNNHSLGLKTDGTLLTWGFNSAGQLGDGTTIKKSTPVQIGTGYKAISAGYNYSLALKTDGTLWAWGSNTNGQLGDGTVINKNTPVLIGSDYSAIATGRTHSLALKTDGTLWAWGSNSSGQLGNGTIDDKNIPIQIGSGYKAIAAGLDHSLALKTDGTVWAWGRNDHGQAGNETNAIKNSPTKVDF